MEENGGIMIFLKDISLTVIVGFLTWITILSLQQFSAVMFLTFVFVTIEFAKLSRLCYETDNKAYFSYLLIH